MNSAAFAILGGLGLFYYGLRSLLRRFESFASTRFRPHLQRSFSNPFGSWLLGVLATLISQSSPLTVIALMGLVDIGFVTLRSAYLSMLGASVSSTAGLWLVLQDWHLGPLLVAVGACGLLLVKSEYWEELTLILLSVGLALMGLGIIYGGVSELLGPILEQRVADSAGSQALREQLFFVGIGTILGLVLQSASAPLVLLLSVAQPTSLTAATGTSLFLGASLGLTATSLMLSLSSTPAGKRLAWAHFITTLSGVMGALFLFPTFLSLANHAVRLVMPFPNLLSQLVAAQLLFTLINSLIFGILVEPMMKILANALPEKGTKAKGLAKRVRRMLFQDPKLAHDECFRQLRSLELEVKANYDQVLRRLTTSDPSDSFRERALRERNFRSIKFTIHDLIFAVDRVRPEGQKQSVIILSLLEYFGAVSRTLFHLEDLYEKGLSKKFELPKEFLRGVAHFRALLDDVWYEILLEHPQEGVIILPEDERPATLEEIVLANSKRLGIEYQGYNTWLIELAGDLRLLSSDLGHVLQRQAQLRGLGE